MRFKELDSNIKNEKKNSRSNFKLIYFYYPKYPKKFSYPLITNKKTQD